MTTSKSGTGGNVHVSQVAVNLLQRGHLLYTNLPTESQRLTYFSLADFRSRAKEIDLFYVRIHGVPFNDELTLLRQSNYEVPCIWEINAPLEEMRLQGVSEIRLAKLNQQRKSLSRLVDGAICVSEEMAEYARCYLGIRNCIVIPNGSDPNLFNSAKRSPSLFKADLFVILWAGSQKYSWQGLKFVKEAAARLQRDEPDILFAVTAEGKSHDNLLYLGKIPYDQMPTYMASANVGLCLYETIGFYHEFFFSPLKLYDYMASSLPVIGTRVGQVKHVLEKYGNGLLTDNSMEDLVEKILYLKRNRQEAREMGQKGRLAVEEVYKWGHVVEQSERFMTKVCGEYRKPDEVKPLLSGAKWLLWRLRYRLIFNISKPILRRIRNGIPMAVVSRPQI